ncbi:unnamed protein product [Sympodiomycopsis kandeliae]
MRVGAERRTVVGVGVGGGILIKLDPPAQPDPSYCFSFDLGQSFDKMRATSLLSISRSLTTREAATASSSSSTTASSSSSAPSPFTTAHRSYVKSLYKRILKNELNWLVRRDLWRDRAIEVRAEFERNRDIRNPREIARVLDQAEKQLKGIQHPDPYKPAMAEDGTKWERNLPPRMFTEAEKKAFADSLKDIL